MVYIQHNNSRVSAPTHGKKEVNCFGANKKGKKKKLCRLTYHAQICKHIQPTASRNYIVLTSQVYYIFHS